MDSRYTRLPGLPQELIDYIIDFLHDDKKSLSSCALTHRTWVNTTRYHLFRRIYATVPVEPTPTEPGYVEPYVKYQLENGKGERSDNGHDIDEVIEMLGCVRYTHYRRYIRHLLIKGSIHRAFCTLSVDKIVNLLTLLPSLESLSLFSIRLYPLTIPRDSMIPFKIGRLAFSDVAAAPSGTISKQPILDTIALFSHIGNILVSDFYAGRVGIVEPPPPPENRVQIAGVSAIRLRDFDLLRALLLHSAQMDAVTSFSASITSPEHIQCSNNFLACFVPEKLNRLEFDFRWIDCEVDYGKSVFQLLVMVGYLIV